MAPAIQGPAASPLISATVIVPFSEAKAAFAHMASGAHFGKVAIAIP